MIPTIARLFKISLDELFEYDVNDIENEIEKIRLEYNNYFWSNFEKAQEILLRGLEKYPTSVSLKTELFELYTYNLDKGEQIINKAFELSSEIIHLSQDVFCTCRTKANLILIYQYLQKKRAKTTNRIFNLSLIPSPICTLICCKTKCGFRQNTCKEKKPLPKQKNGKI